LEKILFKKKEIMGKILVGFTGRAGAGKTSICKMISHGARKSKKISTKELAFATPLKKVVGKIFDWSPARIEHGKGEIDKKWSEIFKTEVTPRSMLQKIGMAFRTEVDPDFWVKLIQNEVAKISDKGSKDVVVLFSDVRFPNEVDFIKSQGGILVKVLRPGELIPADHPSEKYWNEFEADLIWHNNLSLEDQKNQLKGDEDPKFLEVASASFKSAADFCRVLRGAFNSSLASI
jgi:hypothetical protein